MLRLLPRHSKGCHQEMIHYELIILYGLGLKPKDVISTYGYSRASAYRFHRIYRIARKRARNIVTGINSVSLGREKKTNNLGALRAKKRVSHKEKWKWELKENGTTIAKKVNI